MPWAISAEERGVVDRAHRLGMVDGEVMGILDAPDRWTIEWSESLASGKRVTLRNRITGQCASGHDWSDWDVALQRALLDLAREGDLVTEVEEFLRSR